MTFRSQWLATLRFAVHHARVTARNNQISRYGYRLTVNDDVIDTRTLLVDGDVIYLRSPDMIPLAAVIELRWGGPGGILVEGQCEQIGAESPDGWRTAAVRLRRVYARESQQALVWYLRQEHGLSCDERPKKKGAYWGISLIDDDEPARHESARHESASSVQGPSPKIAGQAANTEPAPALETGYAPTTSEDILTLLETNNSKIGVYLNVPCAYLVAGASYWGRALRLNERWLQINTNAVIPGLGVRMRADLTLEVDGIRRAVSVHGVMSRKKELAPGGAYKATLALMIRSIDEGDSPGLMRLWLEQHLEARQLEHGR